MKYLKLSQVFLYIYKTLELNYIKSDLFIFLFFYHPPVELRELFIIFLKLTSSPFCQHHPVFLRSTLTFGVYGAFTKNIESSSIMISWYA